MTERTSNGNVTEDQRKKSGMRGGKFPIFDHRSAMAAIKLRHNGKGISAAAVLAKALKWANENSDDAVKNAVAKAREVDRSK